jgi:PKD repeat protein
MALDPQFATTRHVYLLFTEELRPDDPDRAYPANGKIIRVTGSAADPYVADPASRVTLLTGYDHQSTKHGPDGLAFDGAGRLLAGFGDGQDPRPIGAGQLKAQNLDLLNGKLVRIDPVTGLGVPGNPYYDSAQPGAVRSKVLARGFRNPWRFSVDPSNGNVYVGDVGSNLWEEINTIRPSTSNPNKELNAGWPCYEGENGVSAVQPGYSTHPDTAPTCAALYEASEGGTGIGALAPTYAYHHDEPGGENGSSITAGPVYTGTTYPAAFRGKLFVGDYARSMLRTVDPATGAAADFGAAGDIGNPVDIKQTPTGNIAYLSIVERQIKEIVFNGGNSPPAAVATADVTSGPPPLTVQFNGDASADADQGDTLSYQWNFGDGTPVSSEINPQHTYNDAGSFTATLTVSDGHPGGIDTDSIAIDVGNSAPTVSFVTPAPTPPYRIGSVIPIEIDADDPEDGPLGGASVAWEVIVHHLGHLHPEQAGTGTTGSYTVTDHDSDDTFLEFKATATDSLGRSTTVNEFVQPEKVNVTLLSDPPNVDVVVDDQTRTTPYTWAAIVGGRHQITAPGTTADATGTRRFDSWDSSATSTFTSTLDFFTPAQPLELAATYRPAIDGLSIGDASITEGDDKTHKLAFNIALPAPLPSAVAVNWATAPGSAATPGDFQTASGTATISAGKRRVTVYVKVKGDTQLEADEHFFVNLSGASGAPISDGLAVARILDDEPLQGARVDVGDASIVEGDASKRDLAFTLTLAEPPAGSVTVSYEAVAGTASSDDFRARTGTLTMSASNRTKTVQVDVIGDLAVELTETVLFRVTGVSGAAIGRAGTGRIVADD